MTEEYTIHLTIDLKNITSLEEIRNLLRDSATNLNCEQEYFTHETEGINNRIKRNNLIYVVEFSILDSVEKYIQFIKTVKKVKIELVCERNTIMWMSKQYDKSLDTNIVDREYITRTIEVYKCNNRYSRLYKLLQNR